MAAPFLECIDWSRPWLAHVRTLGQEIAEAPDWRVAINTKAEHSDLRNRRGLPIRFVPQVELPAGVAYETFIHDTGCVPTRDNLHDFFNALVWLTFPQVKVQLNVLQALEIESARLRDATSSRGKVRDAATIFDENAALFVTSDASLVDALRAHEWQDVFLTKREEFVHSSRVFLFGHALMEKLVAPYKSITGHMWAITENVPSLSAGVALQDGCNFIDDQVADQLKSGLTTDAFSPLPVLGIPNWWNRQDKDFYSDEKVFRPRRHR
jgi:hypothetical protein